MKRYEQNAYIVVSIINKDTFHTHGPELYIFRSMSDAKKFKAGAMKDIVEQLNLTSGQRAAETSLILKNQDYDKFSDLTGYSVMMSVENINEQE